MTTYDATYSPDDNKLRLYASTRLDAQTYQRVKAAGFRWAPRQELFVAPMWTPNREDLLLDLCGEIGDEDTSLIERAEQRAERFEDLSEKRAKESQQAQKAVEQLAEHIPFGQPILVGHHSEKAARRDARRIENGIRRAVGLWESVAYWRGRAAGALQHAKYLERPDVRARRIKTIEADQRKQQRYHNDAVKFLKAWNADGFTRERALLITNHTHIYRSFSLATYPRELPASQYEGPMSLWSALDGQVITAEQAKAIAIKSHTTTMAWAERWIAHYQNRLAYERAMLGETGYVEPPKRVGKAALPLLNYAGTVEAHNRWREGTTTYEAKPITRADFAKIPNDYKGTLVAADGTHRVRMAMGAYLQLDSRDDNARHGYYVVVLTDSKQHARPGQDAATDARIAAGRAAIDAAVAERAQVRANNRAVLREQTGERPSTPAPEPSGDVDALRGALAAGVQVVTAPLLFPTSAELAGRMVELAELETGQLLLEPSAGTGVLLDAVRATVPGVIATAVEFDYRLTEQLRLRYDNVRCADFLRCNDLGQFDRVLMNPPFNQAADIAHIEHAFSMLRSGGRLVAVCANGPKQNAKLRALVEATGGSWEDLPEGSFKHAGTNVRTALVILNAP